MSLLTKRKTLLLGVGIILATAFLSAGIVYYGQSSHKTGIQSISVSEHSRLSRETDVLLYFAAPGKPNLTTETRRVSFSELPEISGKVVLNELIKGPRGKLSRTLPSDTRIKALYITDQKTAVVDFSSEISDKHPGGAMTEMLSLFSVVNSLVLNIDDIKAVKILIEGKETDTLAGHISIRETLKANLLLVR